MPFPLPSVSRASRDWSSFVFVAQNTPTSPNFARIQAAVFSFPEAHRRKIRTVNLLERVNNKLLPLWRRLLTN